MGKVERMTSKEIIHKYKDYLSIEDVKSLSEFSDSEGKNRDRGLTIKIWKPNLIQKILIKLKLIKDKRYNGKTLNYYLDDEVGHYPRYTRGLDDWT